MTPPSPHVDTLAVGDRIGREQGVTCCGTAMGFHGGGSLALWECPVCHGRLYVDHDPAHGDYTVAPTPGRPGWPTTKEKQMTDIMKQTVTPAQHAQEASDAVQQLNHATLIPLRDGWAHPNESAAVVGNLDSMAFKLPQALRQIRKFLDRHHNDGTLKSIGQVGVDLAGAKAELAEAENAARQLQAALARAHIFTSRLCLDDTPIGDWD